MSSGPRAWVEPIERAAPDRLAVGSMGRTVVVAAHPDDETLACAGLLQAVHAADGRVELVVATDGEAAFPGAGPTARAELGRTRRRELRDALGELGMADVIVHWLAMPDSALGARALTARLRPLLAGADTYLAPWHDDPHPDHRAAGRAAAAAAPVTARGWAYPIWMWPCSDPLDPAIPWDRAVQHVLPAPAAERKRAAIARFTTQLAAAPGGGPPILPPAVLAHFDTGRELLFRVPRTDSAPPDRFAELYRDGDGDPWRTRRGWYELRKRAVLLACLPRQRYRWAAEPGCGLGLLTRALAARCDRVDASDYTAEAVDATRRETEGIPGVQVAGHALPADDTLPDGIDLAVLSEVLYYLSPTDLAATADRLARALRPGGDAVLVHWLGWPEEAPSDAVATHRVLSGDARFETLVEHTDAEFLLHVLRRR